MSHNYAVRYLVEPWNKPPENIGDHPVIPGVRPSKDNYGYCDKLLIASVVNDREGDMESILLMSDEGPGGPSRELLKAVRDQINHQLKYHM